MPRDYIAIFRLHTLNLKPSGIGDASNTGTDENID
jgi:hypothetical protein